MTIKRWLALRRWWIVGATAGVVAVRILIAVGTETLGGARGLLALTTVLDVLALGLAVAGVIAFVQYGRLFNARVPTE